jgi:hypothetical protein
MLSTYDLVFWLFAAGRVLHEMVSTQLGPWFAV